MEDLKTRLKGMMQQLETERDELKVKLGLAKLEARDEWKELETKMDALRGRMKVVGEGAKEASGDVAAHDASTNGLINEIKRRRKTK